MTDERGHVDTSDEAVWARVEELRLHGLNGDMLLALLDRAKRAEADKSWRCFHCDEVFITKESAMAHFGKYDGSLTACELSKVDGGLAVTVRRLEDELGRYYVEDSDMDRKLNGIFADHRQALIREEEIGFAKGLAAREATIAELESNRAIWKDKVEGLRGNLKHRDATIAKLREALVEARDWAKGFPTEELEALRPKFSAVRSRNFCMISIDPASIEDMVERGAKAAFSEHVNANLALRVARAVLTAAIPGLMGANPVADKRQEDQPDFCPQPDRQ